MKIKAFLNINFHDDLLHAMPGEKDDTLGRLKIGLEKCSTIEGLKEMHIVFGSLWAVAVSEVNSMEGLSNILNEIEKVFPVMSISTYIVEPQLRPGQKERTPFFVQLRARGRYNSIAELIDWYNNRMHGSLNMRFAETPNQAFIRKMPTECWMWLGKELFRW